MCSHHHHHHHHVPDGATPPVAGATPLKGVKGMTPGHSEGPTPTHHHHHHHGRAVHSQVAKPPTPVPIIPIPLKTKTIVHSTTVLSSVASEPRRHLGDFVYDPGLKPGRLVSEVPTHRGFSSNPKPLPLDLIKGNHNCTLTVKVHKVHLSPVGREEITARRFLWGTDIYTDDSDIVAACIHGGWIKGEWTEEIDTAMLDLNGTNESKRRKPKSSAIDAAKIASEELITTPPPEGPMSVPADRDLHVVVVILPRLLAYASTTRYGITSREFGGEFSSRNVAHDGLSFMVHGIRWVANGGQSSSRLRGKERRERMRRAMKEVHANFANVSAADREQDRERIGKMRAEISGSNWRKKDANGLGAEVERSPQEEKENVDAKPSESAEGVVRQVAVVKDELKAQVGTEQMSKTGDEDVEMGETVEAKESAEKAEAADK